MDSAREEVLQFYRSHGAEVVSQGEDQDSTDLGKCLAYLERRLGERQLRRLTVVVLGAPLQPWPLTSSQHTPARMRSRKFASPLPS